jgi:hypothetical protein
MACVDDFELVPDLHAQADWTFGPCGDPDCPTGQLDQQVMTTPQRRRNLRLVD